MDLALCGVMLGNLFWGMVPLWSFHAYLAGFFSASFGSDKHGIRVCGVLFFGQVLVEGVGDIFVTMCNWEVLTWLLSASLFIL